MILSEMAGTSSITRPKSLAVITTSRVGSSAVTVAVRGPSSSRDISPKNEPAGIEPTLRPLIDASAMPSATTKNSSPASPSLVSTVPDGTRRSSATAARRPTSFLLRAENIDTF